MERHRPLSLIMCFPTGIWVFVSVATLLTRTDWVLDVDGRRVRRESVLLLPFRPPRIVAGETHELDKFDHVRVVRHLSGGKGGSTRWTVRMEPPMDIKDGSAHFTPGAVDLGTFDEEPAATVRANEIAGHLLLPILDSRGKVLWAPKGGSER